MPHLFFNKIEGINSSNCHNTDNQILDYPAHYTQQKQGYKRLLQKHEFQYEAIELFIDYIVVIQYTSS